MLIRVGGVSIIVMTVMTLIKLFNKYKQLPPVFHVTLLASAPSYVEGYTENVLLR